MTTISGRSEPRPEPVPGRHVMLISGSDRAAPGGIRAHCDHCNQGQSLEPHTLQDLLKLYGMWQGLDGAVAERLAAQALLVIDEQAPASPVPYPDPVITCGDCKRSARAMTEIAWDQYAGRWRCVGGCDKHRPADGAP